MKSKTYVFSAIVMLIISFSDKAESKSMEIDRRLERAVEAWRNGPSHAQADTDTDTDTSDSDDSDTDTDTSSSSSSDSDTSSSSSSDSDTSSSSDSNSDSDTDTDTSSSSSSDSDTDSSNRQAEVIDSKTGIKYGCYWSNCWRSCQKGEHIVDNKDLCEKDEWCYSDLGLCAVASGCREAVKWGCYGNGTESGRIVQNGCNGERSNRYHCDTATKKSFGCSVWSVCWRSCDSAKEKNCGKHKAHGYGWCYVDAGACSFDKRCIVATVLDCLNL